MSQQYSHREVLAELERVLASKGFAGASRAARFLKYVVDRSLANDRAGLKEVVIGTEIFDRPAGYDPKIEPIVESKRGVCAPSWTISNKDRTDSAVRISIPKGAYRRSRDARNRRPSDPSPREHGLVQRGSSSLWQFY
jgi:hypothetical protein